MHPPTPNSFVTEDSNPSPPSPFDLTESLAPISLWKTTANAGAAATLVASFTPASFSQTPLPTRSITLAGGTQVVFAENDVPCPPSISFARDVKKDIVMLNGMWDDHTEHWAGFSFLKIQGHPTGIPIVFWKAVYSAKQGNSWKPGEWKIIKSNYFDWKVSVLTHSLFRFVSSCVFIHRFWSHAGAKEHQSISGQSSVKEGSPWVTREYFVGWQQSEKQKMSSCFSKRGVSLAPTSTPNFCT
jgi:hypothetical protein